MVNFKKLPMIQQKQPIFFMNPDSVLSCDRDKIRLHAHISLFSLETNSWMLTKTKKILTSKLGHKKLLLLM